MSATVSNWTALCRLLGLVKQYRWGCMQLVLLQVVILGTGLTGLALMGLAVDAIAYYSTAGRAEPIWPMGLRPPADWSPVTIMAILAAAILLTAAVRGMVSYFYAVASAKLLQEHIVVELRSQVYQKLQRLSLRFYSNNISGSLINRVTSDVQAVRSFVDGVAMQVLILVLSLGIYLIYMLRIHVGLTIACLATTPVLWLLSVRFSRRVRPAYVRNRELFDDVLLLLSENVRGMPVVKGFGRQKEETAKFQAANGLVRDQQYWIFWRISTFVPTTDMLMSLNLVVLLGYGGYLVIHGSMPLGSGLIVFSGLLQQFAGQVTKMTNIVNTIQQSLAGAQRVFEILDAPVEIGSPARPRKLNHVQGEIEFDRVSFGYHPGQSVLKDISFHVEAGQRVGIFGATGVGKTTLLNLLPRFYDATAGQVTLDGIDVRHVHLGNLRHNIGMVFQENFLFSDTVAANIAWGCPNASRAQIRRAAEIAAAHDFIGNLPNGYDTVLREGGKDLSGGQRQRLAIARAVLLEPAVLLLDDPTAAVDASTEEEILNAMERAMEGRTTLLVTHRWNTLRRTDWILVMDAGSIVEQGTHNELIARRGVYWNAARLKNNPENTKDNSWRRTPSPQPAHC